MRPSFRSTTFTGSPRFLVDPERELVTRELRDDLVDLNRNVQSPRRPAFVLRLDDGRAVRRQEGAHEGAEVLHEDRLGRVRVRRARCDAAPHHGEEVVGPQALARVERPLDPAARVVREVLLVAQPGQPEVAAVGEEEAPPAGIPAVGVLVAAAPGEELPAQRLQVGERGPHPRLDLGCAGRLHARPRALGRPHEVDRHHGDGRHRRDGGGPERPAPGRMGLANRGPLGDLGGQETLQLGVERGPVLGSFELAEGGAEEVVAHRLHAVPPSATRREARARFSREATVPSGTPSTWAASR